LLRLIPNLLTLGRLVLVPVVLRAMWTGNFGVALAWCFVAGLTDALDGALARGLHARSRIGAYLDPVADKLLLSGIYLVFALRGDIPWWITAIVFGRDAMILAFVGYAFAFTSIRDFPPTVWGKLSTMVQVIAALMVLLSGVVHPGPGIRGLEHTVLGAAVLATLWSAIHYAIVAGSMLRRNAVKRAD